VTEGGSTHNVPPIALAELVNRLSFDSESVQDGKVLPSAIATSDLKERGFSLDRDFVTEATISARIEYQKTKKPGVREVPYVSRMVVSDILEIQDQKDAEFIGPVGPLFTITADPVPADDTVEPNQPENLAHCYVLSSRKLGDGGLRQLRNRLLPLLQNLVTVDQFLDQRNPTMPSA